MYEVWIVSKAIALTPSGKTRPLPITSPSELNSTSVRTFELFFFSHTLSAAQTKQQLALRSGQVKPLVPIDHAVDLFGPATGRSNLMAAANRRVDSGSPDGVQAGFDLRQMSSSTDSVL